LANHSLKISTSNRPTSTVSELGGHRCPSASELARLGGFSAAFSTGLGGAEEVNKKNMSSLPHKKNMFFSIFFSHCSLEVPKFHLYSKDTRCCKA
jgi:hypothetical protein